MINNYFRLIGRVYGKPKSTIVRGQDGRLKKGMKFVLQTMLGEKVMLYPMEIGNLIYEKSSVFVKNGNILSVEGAIFSHSPIELYSTKQIQFSFQVTNLTLLQKSKGKKLVDKDYVRLMQAYDMEKLR